MADAKQQDGLVLLAKIAIAAMDGDTAKAAAAIRAGLADKKPTSGPQRLSPLRYRPEAGRPSRTDEAAQGSRCGHA